MGIRVVSMPLLLQTACSRASSRPPFALCRGVEYRLRSGSWVVSSCRDLQFTPGSCGEECPLPRSPANRQACMSPHCRAFASRGWKMVFQDSFNLHFSYKEVEYLHVSEPFLYCFSPWSVCSNLLPYYLLPLMLRVSVLCSFLWLNTIPPHG